MGIHISRGNMKLGKHIHNISLPPGATCPAGVPCASSYCYARKAWKQYPSVRRAWGENLAEYIMNPKGYMVAILEHVWKHKPKRFRWHVAGDIPNQEYLNYMKMVSGLGRETAFMAFTKRYELSYNALPRNLSIIISAWPGYSIVHVPYSRLYSTATGFLPIAWCQDGSETRIPPGAYECPGSCEKCDYCWHPRGDVWFHKH